MPNIQAAIKGTKAAPKSLRSSMETLIITSDQVNEWRIPPFQRPLRVNAKVQAIAEEMKANGCEISGVVTLGRLTGDPVYYVVDGQHRVEAFRLSGMKEIIADVRVVHFDSMADMSDEFVRLNTALVRMRPDDLLRGLTPGLPPLQKIMRECSFVGYDQVRRGGESGPVVGLSAVIRCWDTSGRDVPTSSSHGSIGQIAMALDEDSARKLIRFLNLAHEAWGRDPEYYRLWANCNLGLCMWLYRRIVLDTSRRGGVRIAVLKDDQFSKCMVALSANPKYLEWLRGRLLNDRDRSPGYTRIKTIFARRLVDEGITKTGLPSPPWASNTGSILTTRNKV